MADRRGPKNLTQFEKEARLHQVEQLRLHGKRDWEIAQEVGISKRQVYFDLKTVETRWQQANLADLDAHKKAELAKIENLARTYWEAWERSLQEKQTTSTEHSDSEGGSRKKAAIKREQKEGNPAYLAGIQWCIDRRCKLLGLDAPTRLKLTDMSNEELIDLARSIFGP